MLVNHNHYVHIFCHAFDILQRYDPNDDVSIRLRVAPTYQRHRVQYNLPSADEVAVILPGVAGDNSQHSQRDIILQNHTGELQIISDLHPAYVPLYYVLFFPYGDNGWHPEMKLQSFGTRGPEKRLTQTRYVAYRLQVRENEYSTLLRGGRLLQRYIVDMFASIDQGFKVDFSGFEQTKQRSVHVFIAALKMRQEMVMIISTCITLVRDSYFHHHILVDPVTCNSAFKIRWQSHVSSVK